MKDFLYLTCRRLSGLILPLLITFNIGCSRKSTASQVTPATPVATPSLTPTAPNFQFSGATSAENLNDTQIQIHWALSSEINLKNYRIYLVNSDETLTTINTVANDVNQYTLANLNPNTIYTFLVRGVDINGNTDINSTKVSALTYAGVSSSSVIDSTTATLNFPSVSVASSLKIYCSVNGSAYSLFGTTNSNSTSYNLTGLAVNSPHTCKVVAVSSNGLEDSNSQTTSFTPSASSNFVLTFSGLSSATLLSGGSQTQLSWTLGTGADIENYRISEVSANGTDLTTISTVSKVTSSVTLSGLSLNSFHTYVVHALSSTGVADNNNVKKSIYTYLGVTSSAKTGTTTASITFPSSGSNTDGVYT